MVMAACAVSDPETWYCRLDGDTAIVRFSRVLLS
jgi:hypothetical protein